MRKFTLYANRSLKWLMLAFFVCLLLPLRSQTFAPVPLTAGSFNFDAVAESFPATGSSASMDASDYALYSQSYPGNPGGGMPNSLTASLGGVTYNLRPYSGLDRKSVV